MCHCNIGYNALQQFLISDPDVAEFTLTGAEDFIIIGCDGLWDVFTDDSVCHRTHRYIRPHSLMQAVAFVQAAMKVDASGHVLPGVAEKLVTEALNLGSKDNVSVIIVYFNKGAAVTADSKITMQ